jgi:hypothetical protein
VVQKVFLSSLINLIDSNAMSEIQNPLTKRYVKIGSPAHKRLVRSGTLPAVEQPETPEPAPEFNEKHLQTKLAEISTDMIKSNLKTIVKAQKLTDKDMDILIKKLLFEKLCIKPDKPKEKKETKEKKKKKFKIVEPSSSESESESD